MPWRLELLINAAGPNPVTVAFPLEYRLPAAHILMPDEPAVAAWVEAWRDARVNIAILAVLLTALTAIFVFQAQLARSRLAHRLVRNGFLAVGLALLRRVGRAAPPTLHWLNPLPEPLPRFVH